MPKKSFVSNPPKPKVTIILYFLHFPHMTSDSPSPPIERSLNDWNSTPRSVTHVDPYSLQAKSLTLLPWIGGSTPPQTLIRPQFVYSSQRRKSGHGGGCVIKKKSLWPITALVTAILHQSDFQCKVYQSPHWRGSLLDLAIIWAQSTKRLELFSTTFEFYFTHITTN